MKTLLIVLGAICAIAVSTTAIAFLGLPYQPLGREFLQANPYGPISISAEVSGSATPEQVPNATTGDSITNGDFTILAGRDNSTIGDGIDEITTWDFDFSADPQFSNFPTSGTLESARVTLTLTPKAALVSGDIIRISGLADINPPAYAELTQDTTSTVEVELLDFYSSEEVLGALTSDSGQITMVSLDDTIVSEAELFLAAMP
jgi:hypothetical protein